MTPIAVTVRSWELTVLERLHNVVLYQGDLIDNYQVVLVAFSATPRKGAPASCNPLRFSSPQLP